MRRDRLLAAALVVALVTHPGAPAVAACWMPPVDAAVSDPFREPACRWCPGNRGIEYETRVGQRVTAVESGRVAYAGTVAGVGYVVVALRDGRRVTYGRLVERAVDRGDVVVRGQVVGSADRRFHLGLRDGDRYLDPTPLLATARGRPRLVPTDGAAPAPAPPPVLRCGRPRPPAGGAIAAPHR